MSTTAKPEVITEHKWDAELTNTFIQTLLLLRAELQQSQAFDKIKCKVSFFQECFLLVLLKTANSMKRSDSELSIILLSVCVMEIIQCHVSVCTAVTELPEILCRKINISNLCQQGYTVPALPGKRHFSAGQMETTFSFTPKLSISKSNFH